MKIINGKDLKRMKFVLTNDGCLKEYKSQEKFIPKQNEKYYFITIDGIVDFRYREGKFDDYIIKHNLVFKTKEECDDYKWFLDNLNKYSFVFSKEEWNNQTLRKWFLCFSYEDQILYADSNYHIKMQSTKYFTKKRIEKFIEIVGEERIKKYMFDIWE